MSFSQTKDSDGHTLVALWKTFYKAEEADKPQDESAALEAIKKEAAEKHLAWDWYDAATRYVQVRSSINWKDRSNLQSAMEKELNEFGEPIAVLYHYVSNWGKDKAEEYVRNNKAELQKANNPEFYKRSLGGALYSPALLPLVENDYEYALWRIYFVNRSRDVKDYYGEKYPFCAFIDYSDATNYSDDVAYVKLESFVKKYDGKASALMGRQMRLRYDFRQLNKKDTSKPADYIELRSRCDQFEKDRAKFTGSEKTIADRCTQIKDLIEELDGKDIDATVENGVLKLELRNVKSVHISVEDNNEKVIWSDDVTNKANSYYVLDKLTVKFPDFDDGDYEVKCKGNGASAVTNYHKFTLSMSLRAIAEGYGAYVAEFDTGKPLQTCTFVLFDADRKEIVRQKDVPLYGYTLLPDSFQQYLQKDKTIYYTVRAEYKEANGRLRLTEYMSVRSPNPGKVREIKNTPTPHALVLTDRSAYNPGETLQFKGIFYVGTYEYDLLPEGTRVEAELFDAQGKSLGEKILKTNALGAVAGSYVLEGGSRGGMFRLVLSKDNSTLGSTNVRVDEFVLPTFDVKFDTDNKMYFPGDDIRVSGKVTSYSGHSIGNTRAQLDVRGYFKKDIELHPDGTFSYTFTSEKDTYGQTIPITLTVTDDTGETLSFNTYKTVNYRIPLYIDLKNTVEGEYTLSPGANVRTYGRDWIIRDKFARVSFGTSGLERDGLRLWYEIRNEAGKLVANGEAKPQEIKDISLDGQPSGLYTLTVNASAPWKGGTLKERSDNYTFVKAEDTDTALDMDVSCFFKELGGEDIALQVGATNGPIWMVVELLGSGNVLLEHQIINLKGERGKPGSLQTISYARKPGYPESLTLHVLFFRDGHAYEYDRKIKLPVIVEKLPLSFTRFTDMAAPGDKVSLLIQTEPGVECAATVFDKATETIQANRWSSVTPYTRPEPQVYYSNVCGHNGTQWRAYYAVEESGRVLRKSAGGMVMESRAAMADNAEVEVMDMMVEEEAVAAPEAAPLDDVKIRENFNATMAWEPFLVADENGQIELKFTGSDRLSTYYVQLFAHTKGMRNEALRKEMKISIPVKVSLVQPLFLYGGDEYTARVSLASSMETPVDGRVSIRFYNGEDYKTAPILATKTSHVSIPAGGNIPFSAPFDVPADVEKLGVLVNFVADNPELGSDAMFVTVPVKIALQTLTEAHSAVLLAGQDREALIASLRSEFINVDASKLEPVERDILAMIREAIPDSIEPKSKNVLALTEAYYSNVIARSVGAKGLDDKAMADIMEKIAACQNSGGGIAWFEGMSSSPIITAAVLQRIAAMPGEDTSSIDVEKAVKYLDSVYFEKSDQPWWCGSISLEYYLQTRALFPSVPFKSPGGKIFRTFKKEAKAYLVPSKARGLNGQILAKARRLRTLQSLVQLPDGKTLAKSWGIKIRSSIVKSLNADVESLLQYAVAHRSGGCYYPNAVMPWRGLLESELYAHSLLCDLLTNAATWNQDGKGVSYAQQARDTAEGIRLWLMIQKETQKWEDDAAYIEAIASVLRGTPETLATKVILLSSTFTKPFPEVKAAGNGFTVKRLFYVNGEPLKDGDAVRVGDKVTARYEIWNEENRSFIRLTAPRPASMRPVAQLSGHYGWGFRPLSYGAWSFTPQGYRNVLGDKTEYWFDTYPEENTAIVEEFFVTQEGTFQMPAVEIESLYAPHYRANDDGRGPLVSK